MLRIDPNPILSRLVAVLAAFVAVCSMGGVSIALGQAGGAMQAAANQVAMNAEEPLDGSAAPATLESQALESEVIPATVTYLAREYVWGNGDWGVDELLAQYDADRRASWPLQDAGGDVIALCDRGGAGARAPGRHCVYRIEPEPIVVRPTAVACQPATLTKIVRFPGEKPFEPVMDREGASRTLRHVPAGRGGRAEMALPGDPRTDTTVRGPPAAGGTDMTTRTAQQANQP
jgi:hypothetical protein